MTILLYDKFDIPGCWHFENGATHIIEHVDHGPDGLLHVLVLTVHLLGSGSSFCEI